MTRPDSPIFDGHLFLVATIGLPASGKTTWALEWLHARPKRMRANRDTHREALFDRPAPLTDEQEDIVTEAQHAAIRAGLARGWSVVADDTNLSGRGSLDAIRAIAAEHGAVFHLEEFRHVPLEVCIARDRARRRPVGEGVIRAMDAEHIPRPHAARRLHDVADTSWPPGSA